jgi:hypothetical protein
MKNNGHPPRHGDPAWEREVMLRAMKQITRSKQAARRFLLKHGFITADGRLGKAYR